MKISILGSPGSGKTTVSEMLRKELELLGYFPVGLVREAAREWIKKMGRQPETVYDQYDIIMKHIMSESNMSTKSTITILDGDIFQNLVYFIDKIDWHKKDHLVLFNEIRKFLVPHNGVVFFIPSIIWYKKDDVRKHSWIESFIMSIKIVRMLLTFKIPFVIIWSITRRGRIDNILKHLLKEKTCQHIQKKT